MGQPPRCKTCIYYKPVGDRYGDCHRMMPTVTSRGTQFPRVNTKDWCGEHKSDEDLKAEPGPAEPQHHQDLPSDFLTRLLRRPVEMYAGDAIKTITDAIQGGKR